jgi:RPA family protein
MSEIKKRETAYKLRIGDLLRGNTIFDSSSPGDSQKKLLFVELGNQKLIRINVIANVIDKYESDGERRFGSITLDDGSGQIKSRVFGEDISKLKEINQGDTILIIGVLRHYNELYILPEVIKKTDPRYLLIRKLEIEKLYNQNSPKIEKQEIKAFKDQIIELIKSNEQKEGIDTEEIIMSIKASPNLISQEIKRLLEDGIIYEPKPGRLRYLG